MNLKRLQFPLLVLVTICLASCAKKDATTELLISSSTELFTAEGGTREVTVTSNVQWTVTDTSSWISTITSVTNGGNGQFSLLIQPNSDTNNRSSSVSVKAGNVVKEITVMQSRKTGADVVVVPDSIAPDQTDMRN